MGTLITILLFFLALIIIKYNSFIRIIESIKNDKEQIAIQLDRRYKLFESLIDATKKYMDHEKTTLSKITEMRTNAQSAKASGDDKSHMKIENELSRIAGNLDFTFEAYPTLKADKNVLQLQEEIVNTENKLAFSKQSYNDSLEEYNAKKKRFPDIVVVKLLNKSLNIPFVYWTIANETIDHHENYKIHF